MLTRGTKAGSRDEKISRMETYGFRRMTVADLPTVWSWLTTPAVREWWIGVDGLPSAPITETDLDAPDVAMWIVSHDGRPFAFLQDYDPHAVADHHFGHLPPRSRGIDQFIGDPDLIGCGHGPAFLRAHAQALFACGAPVLGTDPHPLNARAIRAYEKAGFVRGAERMTEWGPCLLMTLSADKLG